MVPFFSFYISSEKWFNLTISPSQWQVNMDMSPKVKRVIDVLTHMILLITFYAHNLNKKFIAKAPCFKKERAIYFGDYLQSYSITL